MQENIAIEISALRVNTYKGKQKSPQAIACGDSLFMVE